MSKSSDRIPFKIDRVLLIETFMDDADPRHYDHLGDRLFRAGALEVVLSPVQMKKFRPGVQLTVLIHPEQLDEITQILFEETPTLGFRCQTLDRRIRIRRDEVVKTRWGRVRVKKTLAGGKSEEYFPEYEDLRRLSHRHKLPLRKVQEMIKVELAKKALK